MKSRLDRLESRLQAAIEKRLPWVRNENPLENAQASIREAAQAGAASEGDAVYLPDDYLVFVAPERFEDWSKQPEMLEHLTEFIQQEAREKQAHFKQPPQMRLAADPTLEGSAVRVQAQLRPQNLEHTATLPLNEAQVEEKSGQVELVSGAAFLVVNGSETFPIQQTVVNIGRRPDNDLVIDDGRVSRSHAQIRFIQGGYILFDLNSTGGTYVNNDRVSQSALQPGDVISLAGVTLIFGVDVVTGSESTGTTSQIKPASS